MKTKHYSIALAVIAVVTLAGAFIVEANPLYFPPTTQTAVATTTVSWMTPGTGTTTLVVDSYTPGTPSAVRSGILLVSFVGSSTNSQLKISPEYSQASSNGTNCTISQIACDWYQDGGVQVSNYATTTNSVDVGTAHFFSMAFASSTVGGVTGTSATSTRAFAVDLPTRYVRFVISIVPGTAPGSVWAQFIPTKEIPSNK